MHCVQATSGRTSRTCRTAMRNLELFSMEANFQTYCVDLMALVERSTHFNPGSVLCQHKRLLARDSTMGNCCCKSNAAGAVAASQSDVDAGGPGGAGKGHNGSGLSSTAGRGRSTLTVRLRNKVRNVISAASLVICAEELSLTYTGQCCRVRFLRPQLWCCREHLIRQGRGGGKQTPCCL